MEKYFQIYKSIAIMKQLNVLLIFASIFCSCQTFKHRAVENIETKSSLDSISNNENEVEIGGELTCRSKILSPQKSNLYDWMTFISCLSDSLASGNQKYEKTYAQLLNSKVDFTTDWQKAESMLNTKLRGPFIFKNLIANSDIFYCYEDYTLNENGKTEPIHKLFFDAYTSMIRSIDGMSVQEYLDKMNPYTMSKREQRFKDKCGESEYKKNYEVIKQAYEKGLIKLKDYGEE
jgi:hypothetical protein